MPTFLLSKRQRHDTDAEGTDPDIPALEAQEAATIYVHRLMKQFGIDPAELAGEEPGLFSPGVLTST